MGRALLSALLPLALASLARAYYVPGTYPAEFRIEDPLQGKRAGTDGAWEAVCGQPSRVQQ